MFFFETNWTVGVPPDTEIKFGMGPAKETQGLKVDTALKDSLAESMNSMMIDSAKLPTEERQLRSDVKTIQSWTNDTFASNPQALFDHLANVKLAVANTREPNTLKYLKRALEHLEKLARTGTSPA